MWVAMAAARLNLGGLVQAMGWCLCRPRVAPAEWWLRDQDVRRGEGRTDKKRKKSLEQEERGGKTSKKKRDQRKEWRG